MNVRVLLACSILQPKGAGGPRELCGDQAICRANGQRDASCGHTATADVEGVTEVFFL